MTKWEKELIETVVPKLVAGVDFALDDVEYMSSIPKEMSRRLLTFNVCSTFHDGVMRVVNINTFVMEYLDQVEESDFENFYGISVEDLKSVIMTRLDPFEQNPQEELKVCLGVHNRNSDKVS